MFFSTPTMISVPVCFPPLLFLRPVLSSDAFDKYPSDPCSSSMALEGVVCRSAGSSGGRTS